MRQSSRIARKQVYRGGGFDPAHAEFFQVGVKYRVPMYLATSLRRDVAEQFMRNDNSADEKIIWTILMEAEADMYNASLVHRTYFAGEAEYLFTPFSVFTVADVSWRAGTASRPHRITLKASADNKQEPEVGIFSPFCRRRSDDTVLRAGYSKLSVGLTYQ